MAESLPNRFSFLSLHEDLANEVKKTEERGEKEKVAALGDDPLVWIDLEMTGLDAREHEILEIAVVITDSFLRHRIKGPNLVVHQSEVSYKRIQAVLCHTILEAAMWLKKSSRVSGA
jgi:uncharacterized protein YprB with RNaseH-like and TPR domain